ncbi:MULTISPECIES: hypothetical protein [unclassified Sinorhizobium]|uniref:hypothetical protein n=1 Tax=unclassified Sinorhizobium TaxID=2613772 RepID=UPI003524613D
MALAGTAVLAIWNGIAPEAEEEFVAWHVREHIPERVGLPGFLRGRRYVATEGHPKYFNFYETETISDLSSPAYLTRLDSPSPWTKAVVAHFTDTSRTICKVALSKGQGDGAAMMTVRFSTAREPQSFIERLQATADKALGIAGIVGFHLLQGDSAASNRQTAEKKLRDRADEIAAWILLIEAVDLQALERLEKKLSLGEVLTGHGADPEQRGGIYALQYALSASQLPPKFPDR